MKTALIKCLRSQGWERMESLRFGLGRFDHNLVNMLARQLENAGLQDYQAVQRLPEISRNVVKDFEVVISFAPGCSAESIQQVGEGVSDEILQFFSEQGVAASFSMSCLVVSYSAHVDVVEVRNTQDDPFGLNN